MIFSINAFSTILAVATITSSASFTINNVISPLKTCVPSSSSSSSSSSTSLKSSVVTEFLLKPNNSTSFYYVNDEDEDASASQIKSFFETETLGTVLDDDLVVKRVITTESSSNSAGVASPSSSWRNYRNKSHNNSKRRHNYSDLGKMLKEAPDVKTFSLHSSAVTHLYLDMPINDITRAIKRAQNRHDAHDLNTIGAFLIEECAKDEDGHWGYGYRGTLLSRLAVAALHTNEIDLAARAIETRQTCERPSMQPYESAAILRGLFRAGLKDEGWSVLDDELRLPMPGTDLSTDHSQDMIKHRAHALSSIATRFLYQNSPKESVQALNKLSELGSFVAQSNIAFEDLEMPWTRLEQAASTWINKNSGDDDNDAAQNLREHVWKAMASFPCPNADEEE